MSNNNEKSEEKELIPFFDYNNPVNEFDLNESNTGFDAKEMFIKNCKRYSNSFGDEDDKFSVPIDTTTSELNKMVLMAEKIAKEIADDPFSEENKENFREEDCEISLTDETFLLSNEENLCEVSTFEYSAEQNEMVLNVAKEIEFDSLSESKTEILTEEECEISLAEHSSELNKTYILSDKPEEGFGNELHSEVNVENLSEISLDEYIAEQKDIVPNAEHVVKDTEYDSLSKSNKENLTEEECEISLAEYCPEMEATFLLTDKMAEEPEKERLLEARMVKKELKDNKGETSTDNVKPT